MDDAGRRWNLAAICLAAAAVGLIFLTGVLAGTLDGAALRDPEGMTWLLLWASPAPVTALPLLVRRRRTARVMRIVIAVLLWLCSVVTFTPFFIPSAWMMTGAAGRTSAAATGPLEHRTSGHRRGRAHCT